MLVLILTPACASGAATGQLPMRSPSLDYPPPPAQTSDGQIVGADGVPPEDAIRREPRIGNKGLLPAGRPPRPEGVTGEPTMSDPICGSLGVAEAVRKARCNPGAESMPAPKP